MEQLEEKRLERFMERMHELDAWMHGYVRGRAEAGMAEYPLLFMRRVEELEREGVGGEEFRWLIAQVSASPAERQAWEIAQQRLAEQMGRVDSSDAGGQE